MEFYEAWGLETACTFSTREGCADLKAKGMMIDFEEPANDLVPLFTIRASSWTEAMTAYHEIQGWEPYKPL